MSASESDESRMILVQVPDTTFPRIQQKMLNYHPNSGSKTEAWPDTYQENRKELLRNTNFSQVMFFATQFRFYFRHEGVITSKY